MHEAVGPMRRRGDETGDATRATRERLGSIGGIEAEAPLIDHLEQVATEVLGKDGYRVDMDRRQTRPLRLSGPQHVSAGQLVSEGGFEPPRPLQGTRPST